MPTIIPNLLEGKTLTGVLPPEKQPPLQYFLPLHNQQPELLDIEACIDDPSLAPLGFHVKQKKSSRKKPVVSNGQVHIQTKEASSPSFVNGAVMLRRRGLDGTQLASELNGFLLPSYLKANYRDLVELDISRNCLTFLPAQIQQFVYLRSLNITSNELTEIPKEIYQLKQLQVLSVSQNQIKVLPEEMPVMLPDLVTLRVAANLIDTLPTCLHLWKKMRHLQLGSVYGGNRLVQLPDTLADMPALEELDVSYNQLRSLPTDLDIPTLISLNASHNQLDFIPKSIANCHLLKSLNVSKNHLTSLPADLVNLRKLELFDISENLLCIMPAEILERMQSATLLITGNPLTRPGNCDQRQDAYTRILQQMTQRVVTRSSPVLSRDQCGPRGMGCLQPSSSSSYSQSLPSPPSSPAPANLPAQHDEDATIDQELSFHAQQLNVDGSRPNTPPPNADADLIGTFRSKIVHDSTASSSQYILVDFPRQLPLPTETKLLHSLKEIATRVILKNDVQVPLDMLPPHLAMDIAGGRNKCRSCSYCQGPFVNEWVTSVQVKSFGGHPAVVRRVRFCSTKCWTQCLPKEHSKSVICVHK
ncbi:hypothetical protein MFLAVUS_006009 [Mucor flavus]|uniref:Disease resistance R13L4/SHOC-2-like LRR domain-containing protein n=1 Tax=Mucor flavus TaxID=439312 RepID=A0ABP9Z0C7_9FUNG